MTRTPGDRPNNRPSNRIDGELRDGSALLSGCQPLLAQLYAESGGAGWGLQLDFFTAVLARSVRKRFGEAPPASAKLAEFLSTLHLQDLALASACAEGCPEAWEHFVATYRAYLRSAAAAILRCPAASPAAVDLADSLFADLYGLTDAARPRSLFRYFHGRSSLKTWLRAVLAQRHVDAIRAGRRFTGLDDQQGPLEMSAGTPGIATVQPFPDPHRRRYLDLFHRSLQVALGLLDPRDKDRLRLYYAEEQTLADIGRKLGEHESSVSRNLERTRRELRHQVEQALRKGAVSANGSAEAGLSDAQIALCLEYASEDAPIDFDTLFPAGAAPARKTEGKEP